jgi:hypothetical protein
MINGIAPLFLFYFAEKKHAGWENKEVDGKLEDVYKTVYSKPIPIYLDERLTGIILDNQSNSLAISSDTLVARPDSSNESATEKTSEEDVKVKQKGESQEVSISMTARTDNLFLNLLLPLFKTIYDYALSGKEYYMAYYHKNVLIYNSKLATMTATENRETNEVKINIRLEIKPKKKEKKDDVKTLSPQNKKLLGGQLEVA